MGYSYQYHIVPQRLDPVKNGSDGDTPTRDKTYIPSFYTPTSRRCNSRDQRVAKREGKTIWHIEEWLQHHLQSTRTRVSRSISRQSTEHHLTPQADPAFLALLFSRPLLFLKSMLSQDLSFLPCPADYLL